MFQVGCAIVSAECITERFCCDLSVCRGACCVEGEAGAPLGPGEKEMIEEALPAVESRLAPKARETVRRQGVAYTDSDGDLVTSIVDGKDCVFTCHAADGCCKCVLEAAFREGKTRFAKPASCALYPIRVTRLPGGAPALSFHRWSVCRGAKELGRELDIRVYEFLREPLIRAFGREWYAELGQIAAELERQPRFNFPR